MSLHDRLKNWGKYVRDGRYYKGHCFSIEHRMQPWYSPPESAQIEWLYAHGLINKDERTSMYDDLPKPRPLPLDAADADLVERGWCLMESKKAKDAIRWQYVKRWTQLMIVRKLRVDADFMMFADNQISDSIDKVSAIKAMGLYPSMHNLVPHPVVEDLRLVA